MLADESQTGQAMGVVRGPAVRDRGLEDRQVLAEEGLGPVITAHPGVEQGQVVQAGRVIGVVFPPQFLAEVAGQDQEGFGPGRIAHVGVDRGQIIQTRGVVRTLLAVSSVEQSSPTCRQRGSALA